MYFIIIFLLVMMRWLLEIVNVVWIYDIKFFIFFSFFVNVIEFFSIKDINYKNVKFKAINGWLKVLVLSFIKCFLLMVVRISFNGLEVMIVYLF